MSNTHKFTELEAAQYLGLSVHTLRRRRLDKLAPQFLKMGKSVRYEQSVLEAFVINSRVSVRKEG